MTSLMRALVDRLRQICEIGSREICAPQARVLEARPSEMRIGQVGLVQCRGLEICTLQVSARQVGTL